jgi:type I restriction enzyme, S subunit
MSETPWQSSTLGQIARFRRGVSYDLSTLAESAESARPYLNMKSFHKDGGYNELGLKYFSGAVSEDDLLRGNCLVIANTDVTRDGDIIGAPALVPAELAGLEVVCSHHVTALHLRHECDARFLHHALRLPRYRAAFRQHARGTTVLMLDPRSIEGIAFDRPSDVNEQRQIAEVIDTLDTTLHQTKAIIEKLKQVKQGLLHDLLTRGIDANGELRPPQSQAPHLYKDSPLGWIPAAWQARRLADYMATEITYGIVQAGPHVGGGVPYVRTGDMSGDRLNRASLLCTTRRIADSFRRSEVRAGEIVMAIRATVGKVLPVPPELDGANLTQGTARLAPNDGTDAEFLLWAIRHRRAQDSILAEIKGTTFAEITLAALREVPLAAPINIEEQRLIGERMAACEARIQQEQLLASKLEAQKSGLMDDILTGRVRVTPLLADAHPL